MFKSNFFVFELFFVLGALGSSFTTSCVTNSTSHEIAINALQLELSKSEIIKEELKSLKFASNQIICASIGLIVFTAIKLKPLAFTVVLPLVYLFNFPRMIYELAQLSHERRIRLLKEQIKRLKLEEMQPV